MITSRNYFQKSRVFLLPLTGLPKKGIFQVYNTYLYWDACDGIENYQLIVMYKNENNIEFDVFEKDVIMKCPNVIACYKVNGGNIYIFDLVAWAEDVYEFLNGSYSKFSNKLKYKILQYENFNSIPKTIIKDEKGEIAFTVHIALYPEIYYKEADKELLYQDDYLEKNKMELWSVFDKEKETLIKAIKEEYCCNDVIIELTK